MNILVSSFTPPPSISSKIFPNKSKVDVAKMNDAIKFNLFLRQYFLEYETGVICTKIMWEICYYCRLLDQITNLNHNLWIRNPNIRIFFLAKS